MGLDDEILKELESLGSEQTRKIYRRHGVSGKQFGVSYGDIDKLVKRYRKKAGPEKWQALWKSGWQDARALVCRMTEASFFTVGKMDDWVRDLDNRVVTGDFARAVGGAVGASGRVDRWIERSEVRSLWVVCAGWVVLASVSDMRVQPGVEDNWFETKLGLIEKRIHSSGNEIRDTMNMGMIAIGCRNAELRVKAEAVAKRVGKVEVDHGETSCKTPDAMAYIAKTWSRRNRT